MKGIKRRSHEKNLLKRDSVTRFVSPSFSSKGLGTPEIFEFEVHSIPSHPQP
jgi:hypothetical protein